MIVIPCCHNAHRVLDNLRLKSDRRRCMNQLRDAKLQAATEQVESMPNVCHTLVQSFTCR